MSRSTSGHVRAPVNDHANRPPSHGLAPLHPYFIVRLGAFVADLSALRATQTLRAARAHRALNDALANDAARLSDDLHALVPTLAEKTARGLVLRVRRGIFNGRPEPSGDVAEVARYCSEDVAARLERYRARRQTLGELEREMTERFDGELRSTRRALRDYVLDHDFQRSVLLASPALYHYIRRYVAAVDADAFDARDERAERGLLRYIVRSATKATPFARFCSTIRGRITGDDTPDARGLIIRGEPRRRRGTVRLNKVLYEVLWERLQTRDAVRALVRLTLNSTLVVEPTCVRFLAQIDRRECFQRLGRSDALELALRVLRSAHEVPYRTLLTTLAASPEIDADAGEVRAYVDELIRIGLVRLVSPVSVQNADWVGPLVELLERADDADAKRAAVVLTKLGAAAAEYEGAPVDVRSALQAGMLASVKEIAALIGLPADSEWRNLVYEDTTADASMLLSDKATYGTAFRALTDLLRALEPASLSHSEHAGMRKFFDTYYPDASTVPLLRFYEDYYREHAKRQTTLTRRRQRNPLDPSLRGERLHNPFELAVIEQAYTARNAVAEVVRDAWRRAPRAEEITVSLRDLAAVVAAFESSAEPRSLAVFCELISPGQDAEGRILVRGALTGYGKYFSRFLYLFEADWQQTLLAENDARRAVTLAEIASDTEFNANLHPALTSHEISYPGRDVGGEGETVECRDLDVRRDPTRQNRLRVVHRPSGNDVHPVDLGFQSLTMRSPLYRLLTGLGPGSSVQLPVPETMDGGRHPAPGGVRYRPRIVVENVLVLARRRWVIPEVLFPPALAGETELATFLRVDAWRQVHALPDRTYARLVLTQRPDGGPHTRETVADTPSVETSSLQAGEGDNVPERPVGRGRPSDFNKPQYVDFRSPLLVSLFVRLPGATRGFDVVLEECYPAVDRLPATADGERFAAEMILQVELPGQAAAATSDAVGLPDDCVAAADAERYCA